MFTKVLTFLAACLMVAGATPAQAQSESLPEPVASVGEVPAPPPPEDTTPVAKVADPTPAEAEPVQEVTQTPQGTLVLYDTGGDWGYLGELYATMVGNLSSRFGRWDARPVTEYEAGDMAAYKAVIYAGSTYDEPLPTEFLDDVLSDSSEVLWLGANLWQLHARAAQDDIGGYFVHQYGWQYVGYDLSAIDEIDYQGHALQRDPHNGSGILSVQVADPQRVEVLGQAVKEDGTAFPWAVASGRLTYVGEIPLSYVSEADRYLALADLMYEVIQPDTPERHRAMVRIEDVSAASDPARLQAIADLLGQRGIPFSVAVFPVHVYPDGSRRTLAQTPAVVDALRYMVSKGGTLLQHGYTHQYGSQANPYNGASAEDFEFFMAHIDSSDAVILDGPVPEDSAAWAGERMDAAREAMREAGIASPQIFEFPHYAASHVDYHAAGQRYVARYERSLYYAGAVSGSVDSQHYVGQFFPYEVTDARGHRVIPENIGNISPEAYNQHEPVLADDLIERAQANLAVRDGFASFFFHPYLDPAMLAQVVDGIGGLGYTFVSPAMVLREFPQSPVQPPAAPTSLTTAVTQTTATVSFTAAATADAPEPNAYEYTTNGGATWTMVPADGSSIVLTGLTPNTRYTLAVRAGNAAGMGESSVPATFTTARATVPTAPTAVTLTPGVRSIAVSFTAPTSDGGRPITAYRYTVDGGKTWRDSPSGTATSFLIDGLTANKKYTVRVRAVNAVGVSPASAAVAAIPGPYTPGAPVIVGGTPGSGSATIRFTQPASDGGDPILAYQYSLNGGAWVAPAIPQASSPLVIAGLTNGTSYKVRIRAVNSIGAGPASNSVTVKPKA